MDKPTRRDFLGRTAAAAVVASPVAQVLAAGTPRTARQSANDKLVLGLIACGGMGSSNMRSLLEFSDVTVAAVCDVDSSRIAGDYKFVSDKTGKAPDVYSDYRRMLDRKDIDAVIIGTPDHWHALNLVHACEAGKDSYCEKPISHNIREAKAMVGAQQRFGRVVQVGTWQRSGQEFVDALAYVRSGKLGKVVHCRAWISDGTRIGKVQPSTPPSTLDYDAWIGPAEMHPYQSNKVHWNWRWVMNSGGGLTTDWGVHMLDIALLGMSKNQDFAMPTSASCVGGQWAITDDDRDAPDTVDALFAFDGSPVSLSWSVNRDHPGKPGHGTEFVAADGKTLRVWRGGWVVLDADGKELPKEGTDPYPTNHWRDWVDCVKSRSKPRADLASVARTTMVCHLANAALYSGTTVRWDPATMDIVGKSGRDTMAYDREYRTGYKLPRYADSW